MKDLRLRTPLNRIGFTLLCFGLALVVVSFLFSYERYGWAGRQFADLETLFLDRAHRWWQTGIRYGSGIAVVGAWLAWAYEPTGGRLLRWIKTGQ
ncbi:hypothetical protein [Pseudomonas asiatica]|uniref:hypothetical protein n=1 Tax=Pseudomonas asiatica TaxID=2219225 RepID=UPI003B96688F